MKQKPETDEVKEAKDLAREGVERAKKVLPKEEKVKIGFGWTEKEFVKENMNGSSGMAYSANYIEIDFNSNVDGWKNAVLGSALHETTHTFFYEKIDFNHNRDEMPIWQYILDEALTQNMTEKFAPKASEPWRKEHSKQDIAKHWSKIKKEALERKYRFPDPLFIDKSEGGYPNWLGYSMAYLIGQKLLGEGHNLEEFPELGKEDVVNAGDNIFL